MEENVNTPEPQESAKSSAQAEQDAGAEQPKTADQPEAARPTVAGPEISKDARMWAMFCHLAGLARFVVPVPFGGIIAPLIVWQIKKDEHAFVDENGKEALNFQLSVAIYLLAAILLCFVIIGFLLLPAVAVFNIVFLIIAAVKANNGEHYMYPLTIRFIK
ncbi:MAG: DUF4870 domain-containing protein [Planctomycetota bacterium]|jgi:uncharacterized Tic20 family protein